MDSEKSKIDVEIKEQLELNDFYKKKKAEAFSNLCDMKKSYLERKLLHEMKEDDISRDAMQEAIKELVTKFEQEANTFADKSLVDIIYGKTDLHADIYWTNKDGEVNFLSNYEKPYADEADVKNFQEKKNDLLISYTNLKKQVEEKELSFKESELSVEKHLNDTLNLAETKKREVEQTNEKLAAKQDRVIMLESRKNKLSIKMNAKKKKYQRDDTSS